MSLTQTIDPIVSPVEAEPVSTILAVANRLITLGIARDERETSHPMNHIRVQKLAYLACGFHLANHRQPLFAERPEMWTHGPGFLALFMPLQYWGSRRIETLICYPGKTPAMGNDATRDFVDSIEDRYRNYHSEQLSTLAHRPGSPWKLTAEAHGFSCPAGTTIPDATMIAYFAKVRHPVHI